MPNGIRLDLQRALAEGPGAIPNMEPLFAPGAIPPVFDEAPEVDLGPEFVPGGGPPSGATATFPGEPIDIGNAPIGVPVPPVKPSRGERLRRLLGNFLQNFGEGLTAAARAPSGSGFAAGFGAALSAGEERRLQQVRIDLLRANQASREEIARENIRLRQEDFEADEREREARRIERGNVRAGAERKTFQDILTAGTRRAADFAAGRKQRAQEFEQDKELIRLRDKLAREREGLKPRKAATLTEGERRRLSVEVLRGFGLTQPERTSSLITPKGEFSFMLKRKRVTTVIDRLTRAGLGIEEILRLFERSKQGLREDQEAVTLDSVLDNIRRTPR